MPLLNPKQVFDALKTVLDPATGKGLVSDRRIRDLQVKPSGEVSLSVLTEAVDEGLQKQLKAAVNDALTKIAGATQVSLKLEPLGSSSPTPESAKKMLGAKHLIAVSSGKGGVGKSTVSSLLAVTLASQGYKVGLMDADIYGPNIPTMLGITEEPKVYSHPQRGEVLIPAQIHGMKVMSMGFLLPPDQPVVWRGPMLHSAINQFCYQVDWGSLDYLIVDMPPGTGDVQLSLSQTVPLSGTVLVTTPQEIALEDVRKAYRMWEKVRVPVVGVVENMSFFLCDGCEKEHRLFGEGGGEKLSQAFGTRVLAQIPLWSAIGKGADTGKPVVLSDPDAAVSKTFRRLAEQIAEEFPVRGEEMKSKHSGAPEIQIGTF